MTRFMMTLDDAVDLVLYAFEHGNSGDVFVRKAICRNPSLPKEVLIKLTKDQDSSVAEEALRVLKTNKIIIEESFPTQHGG